VLAGYFVVGMLGGGSSAPTTAVSPPGKILPLGSKFDLTTVKKYNADSKLFSYPKVAPAEVGPALSDIVKAPQ
jgi:hypothetical protein